MTSSNRREPARRCIAIRIEGQVQGVGFRYFLRDKAEEIAIFGFARNEPDGSVYAEAEGEDDNLSEFIEFSKLGPFGAKVRGVQIENKDPRNFKKFEVR